MPEQWQLSPRRIWGHRDRLGLNRAQLGAKVGRTADAIKRYEYGLDVPKTHIFLSLAGSLGISPTDLCRQSPDDEVEYQQALHWSPPTQHLHLMRET